MIKKDNKKTANPKGKYMGPIKVGPKGQVVIPKEVRDIFGIEPGDMLLLLADKKKGIVIQNYDQFGLFFKKAFAAESNPEEEEE